MKKSVKSVLAILLISLMMLTSTVWVGAAQIQEPTVEPLWDNISTMSVDIVFDGSIGEAAGDASKKSGTSRLDIILRVYKNVGGEWVFVDEWTSSTTQMSTEAVGEFSAQSGVEYMATLTAVVYRNGMPEYDTVYIIRTCP